MFRHLRLMLSGRLSPSEEGFRFSTANEETGSYNTQLDDYEPIELADDPVVPLRASKREAERFCKQFMSLSENRESYISSFFNRHDIPNPQSIEDWERIELWLSDVVEISKEPQISNANGISLALRPKIVSLAHDLSYAYARTVGYLYSGVEIDFECIFNNDPKKLYSTFPVVSIPGRTDVLNTRDLMLDTAQFIARGNTSTALSTGLQALGTAQPAAKEYKEEFIEIFREEYGREPTTSEMVDYLRESGLSESAIADLL